jgi:FGGY family of carbohydrate kinases, N-terminal domain
VRVLALDQGTSATKALVVDDDGAVAAQSEVTVTVRAGADGALEVEPEELWPSVLAAGREALAEAEGSIDAVGFANQGEGRHVAAAVKAWLERDDWPADGVPVCAEAPVRWVPRASFLLTTPAPPRDRFLLRVERFVPSRRLTVVQGDRVLWAGRGTGTLVPNRSVGLPSSWRHAVDLDGPPVRVMATDLR